MPHSSFYDDLGLLGGHISIVTGPLELDGAADGSDCVESDERIGSDRGKELGAEDLLAVIARDEMRDDVARDGHARLRVAKAGLHLVRDKGLDGDDLAAFGFGRNIDKGACHQIRFSRQAPSVMMTLTLSDQKDPSAISPIATTVWESVRRIRVAMLARPVRGPSLALITLGCGFFSLNTWIALT